MKKRKIIWGILIFMVLIQLVSAISIKMDVKDSFGLGEKISFNYSITGSSEEIKYFASVNCPNAPTPFSEIKTGIIPITENYEFLFVTSDIESQTCNFSVLIIEPYGLSKTKMFSITTDPLLQFKINVCKDVSCFESTRVFVKEENIYLDYSSEISSPVITATLKYPDETIQQITLPTSIKANQIGTYELKVIASKEDYKTTTQDVQFGVVSKKAKIDYTPMDDINEAFDNNENFILIIILIIVVVGIFVCILKKLKNK